MSQKLELKKIQVELLRVSAAKAEMEYRIEDFLFNISNLQKQIEIQRLKEDELAVKIAEMQKVVDQKGVVNV